MKKILYFSLLILTIPLFASQPEKLGKIIQKKLQSMHANEHALVMIYLTDKGDPQRFSNAKAQSFVSERSQKRRMKVLPKESLISQHDFPLEQSYVHILQRNVVQLRHQLKWFNAVSALATKEQIESLERFPFVKEIELVGRWKVNRQIEEVREETIFPQKYHQPADETLNYGPSFTQLNQINVPAVHNLGIYGQGVVVGVFDNGFRLLSHEAFDSMKIIAQYDFVDHKESVIPNNPNYGGHGVNTLSTIGGFKPGQLIGPAFKADYILARTENDSSETPIEEDNWAKAIEWADSIGVDVTSTSLGYLDYNAPYPSWTWEDMDGNTTVITRAADRAAQLGIVVVNSAGNSGYDPTHNTLGAPADGDSVIAAGAVDSLGNRVSFSSVGPTSDGRIKPDVMAMGYRVWVASSLNPTGYGRVNGTSFSCPLSAGVAALILCAKPSLTPMQVRDAMRNTASNAGSPNNLMGWGILDALAAVNYFGVDSFARINGTVFNDKNENGIKDFGEAGIEGFSVYLSGDAIDSTTTNEFGDYTFSGLPLGVYTISIILPEEYTQTLPESSYTVSIDSALSNISRKNFGIVPNMITQNYSLSSGWNLLSLPLEVAIPFREEIYPAAASSAFIYQEGYVVNDTLQRGKGFWLKYTLDDTISITGKAVLLDTIDIWRGWNMIGTISEPINKAAIIQIPEGIAVSDYISYDPICFYACPYDSFVYPHVGYWVKASQDGKLVFDVNSKKKSQDNSLSYQKALETLNALIIQDAEGKRRALYVGETDDERQLQHYFELPPFSPQGVFDVRFANNSMVWVPTHQSAEERMNIILRDAVYPLQLSVKIQRADARLWLIQEEEGRMSKMELRNGAKVKVNKASRVQIEYSVPAFVQEPPKEFSLGRNYPNPFNPTTVIPYDVPVESRVTIKVYNIIGEEIAVLVNEVQQAGTHTVEFYASRYPSGVYYYRMTAGEGFTETKKLILMR